MIAIILYFIMIKNDLKSNQIIIIIHNISDNWYEIKCQFVYFYLKKKKVYASQNPVTYLLHISNEFIAYLKYNSFFDMVVQ